MYIESLPILFVPEIKSNYMCKVTFFPFMVEKFLREGQLVLYIVAT
jgi:hypothetical protein